MLYKVLIEDTAFRQLKKIHHQDRAKVIKKIKQLRTESLRNNIDKLKRPLIGHRLRIGDYRALFS